MDLFIARQPIFDRRSRVVGYELLFRSGLRNAFDGTDPDRASASVIADGFFELGIERLVGTGQAYVNFTRQALVSDYAAPLPAERLVVEVLEDVEVDGEVRAACERLKAAGFTLALDDFVPGGRTAPLLDLADIVKVDFRQLDATARADVAALRSSPLTRLLAEKVETADEHAEALVLGYNLFQGYALSRPEIQTARRASSASAQRLTLMQRLQQEDAELSDIEDAISRDPALAFKLLRYVNSAAFGLRGRVGTLRQAISYLGQQKIRAWAMVIILADLGVGVPFELVVTSVVRGRFCELVGELAGLGARSGDLFLLGLFSLLDAITGRPLTDALAEVPLADDVAAALLDRHGPMATVLALVEAYEAGRWSDVGARAEALAVPPEELATRYLAAVDWGHQSGHLA